MCFEDFSVASKRAAGAHGCHKNIHIALQIP